MYKSSMKRDRLPDSASPPPQMSKRSRSTGHRYNNNNEPDSSDDNSPSDTRSSAAARHHHHHHRRSGSGGGGAPPGRRSPHSSRERRYNDDHYSGSTNRRNDFKDGPLLGGPPPLSSSGPPAPSRNYAYKVLCISNLHMKASDEVIRETLYREFKRFGDISVKVVHEPDERLAFVYFRSAEDAREAKHSKSRIIIYDKPVVVEAAYESQPSNNTNTSSSSRGGGEPPGGPPFINKELPFEKNSGYRRSPVYPDRGGPRDDHHHGGPGGNRYDNNNRYDRPMPPPPSSSGPPPPMHYNNRQDYHNNGRRGEPMHHHDNYPPRGGMHHNHNNHFNNRYPPGPPHHQQPLPSGPPPPRGGPHHHHHGHPMDGGPPPQQQGPPPHGGPPGQRYENKKDKFPNYLHHIAPEEDPLATRTLFAGNLEVNITDEELRRIFGRYGVVEDIDIKRPPPGTGNAYAFVRYVNLDMASRAKCELSGQYIGKFQCKIGYGKVNATPKIWIGGLGQWTTLAQLEREFDRFGSIKKIDWIKGEEFAYITYETIDAAQAAVKDMRGYPLGGDKRLRTDFADAGATVEGENQSGGGGDNGFSNSKKDEEMSIGDVSPSSEEDGAGSGGGGDGLRTMNDIAKKTPVAWQGALVLKNSSFPTKLHLMEGDLDGIQPLLKDEEGKTMLRITQRLRLDQSKLDDVKTRIGSSASHGVFLSLPDQSSSAASGDRPLRNLVSYLKQKEAAGVISLLNSSNESGVLYAFPPCPFSWELVSKTYPLLLNNNNEASSEHLVVVVIKGGTA